MLLEGYNAFIGTTNTLRMGQEGLRSRRERRHHGRRAVLHHARGERSALRRGGDLGARHSARAGEPVSRRCDRHTSCTPTAAPATSAFATVLADVDNYPFGWQDGPDNARRPKTSTATATARSTRAMPSKIAHSDSCRRQHRPRSAARGQHATSTDPNPTAIRSTTTASATTACATSTRCGRRSSTAAYAFGKPFTDLQLDRRLLRRRGEHAARLSAPARGRQERRLRRCDDAVAAGAAAAVRRRHARRCRTQLRCSRASRACYARPAAPALRSQAGAGQRRQEHRRQLLHVHRGAGHRAHPGLRAQRPVERIRSELAELRRESSRRRSSRCRCATTRATRSTTRTPTTGAPTTPSCRRRIRINTPMPSGVSPNMLQVCLNSPMMEDPASIRGAAFKPDPTTSTSSTAQFCYTLDFKPGQTTYLDTPVLPIAAFASPAQLRSSTASIRAARRSFTR